MGFIRFVPKNEKPFFEGNVNDQNYEYKEFIFNTSEIIAICHEYDSDFILEDHPRNDSRLVTFLVRCRGTNKNYHKFYFDFDDDDTSPLKYELFIKHLFDNINDEHPLTIEYIFYQFNDAS